MHSKGGIACGELLKQAVRDLLADTKGSDYKIVVRIYADFTKLAQQCPGYKQDPRDRITCLRSFAAGFTTSNTLFDFIDTGSVPCSVAQKMQG
jgi:hypothetical protein